MPDTTLTPIEVAEILKISKNTVYELIKRGELNCYKVGKKLRIDLKDVEEYKNSTKSIKVKSNMDKPAFNPIVANNSAILNETMPYGSNIVICGQDVMLDILSRHLQCHPNGIQALRSYVGSYNGLYELYMGRVHAATAHLWDGETGIYNIPYVKRLLPGIETIIIHLAVRMQGFYVAKGNPKNIKDWQDLKRQDIVLINREKGSGSRILLDEHLRKLNVLSSSLQGYERECSTHLAVASAVARGSADLAIGNEKTGLQVNGVDFIPLQKERYELVLKKEDLSKPHFQALVNIINSEEFRIELEGIGGYDLTELGKIVAET